MSDSALGVGLKARPDSSAVEHLTYEIKGREFEPRSGRLFSRTLYQKAFKKSKKYKNSRGNTENLMIWIVLVCSATNT